MNAAKQSEQLAAAQPTIDAVLSAAGAIGGALAPQFSPFIAMAIVLAKHAPEIYLDVMLLFSKGEPTQVEIDALKTKLSELKNPEHLYK